ncbi:MAG: NAD(P)-binding domain-containing protein, partial [Acidimicrobiia bacterium]
MGKALATGMLAAGWAPEQLSLAIRRPDQVEALIAETGVAVSLDPRQASAGRDVIVVAVKPRDVSILLDALASAITIEQVVLSIAAGVPTSTFEKVLGEVPV